jgi:hypothetical protein
MALSEIMHRITGREPRMWGAGIVGYGSYHYRYASGHEGDACWVGFAARKSDISVYIFSFAERDRLLATLGKYKTGKACLYIKRLADINIAVLKELIAGSVAYIRGLYPE